MAATVTLDELSAWLRLLLTPGVGPRTARKLLMAFGSVNAIFEQSLGMLERLVSTRQAQAIIHMPEQFDTAFQALATWLDASPAHHAIPLAHPDYPAPLLHTADPPLLLYLNGHLELMHHPALAMVGSRRPTPQGKETAADFARTLSQSGLTIISGMAQGIDGISQQAALRHAGSTIAVLGTGIDRVYPANHHTLARDIAEHGLLISEYPLGTPPIADNFPKRNRIIAALALGTLVVEATLRSGSLITARLAAEMGREVFAIPGSIHSPQSKGCHQLIRQGAKLVESAQDILEELKLPAQQGTLTLPAACSIPKNPISEANPVLAAIGEGPTSFEAISMRTGMDTASLQTELLQLELEQQIARLPGGLFQRLHTR